MCTYFSCVDMCAGECVLNWFLRGLALGTCCDFCQDCAGFFQCGDVNDFCAVFTGVVEAFECGDKVFAHFFHAAFFSFGFDD